jgi:hypothetical protein
MRAATVFTKEKILVNLIDNYDDAVAVFKFLRVQHQHRSLSPQAMIM